LLKEGRRQTFLRKERRHPSTIPQRAQLLSEMGIGSLHGVALKVGYENVGVLYLAHERKRKFTHQDWLQLENFALFAASSFKHARILHEVSTIQKAASAVARVVTQDDLDKTLKSIAVEARKALGCDAIPLYACDLATGNIDHLPAMDNVNRPEKVL